jgi:hypothetical protein
MTYEEYLDFEQEQYRANLQAGEEQFDEGKADGAFGYMPQYADDTYLMGYCAGVKQLPIEPDGRIKRFPDETAAPALTEWQLETQRIANAPVMGRKAPLTVRGIAIE